MVYKARMVSANKLEIYIATVSTALILAISPLSILAQENSPSPTPLESPSPSPTVSPTPTPATSPTPSPSPTVGGTESATTDKQKVLGAATTLGATNREREIAKWLIASILGLAAFLLGLKILRTDAQE